MAQGNPLATVDVPPLDPDQTYSLTITLDPLSAGDYPIVGEVDSTNVVSESNEGDNTEPMMIKVASAPDLSVAKHRCVIFQRDGSNYVKVEVVISNLGTEDAGSFKVTLDVPELGITRSGTVKQLSAGSSIIRRATVKNVPSGHVTLRVEIDPYNTVLEVDETNNSLELYEVVP